MFTKQAQGAGAQTNTPRKKYSQIKRGREQDKRHCSTIERSWVIRTHPHALQAAVQYKTPEKYEEKLDQKCETNSLEKPTVWYLHETELQSLCVYHM